MIKKKDKERFIGQTEDSTVEAGQMENNMVSGNILQLQVKQRKDSGKMAKDNIGQKKNRID